MYHDASAGTLLLLTEDFCKLSSERLEPFAAMLLAIVFTVFETFLCQQR